MAITNYTELQAAVANWLNRSDLTARVPEFIALAEARFNRMIWTSQSEATDSQATAAATLTLPTDFRAIKAVYVGTDKVPLKEVSPSVLRREYEPASATTPIVFALVADEIKLGPDPDTTYAFTIEYYQAIPPLADNATNWLLSAHPDIYLYGSLLQAEAFGWNDERLTLWKAALDEALDELERSAARRERSSEGPGLSTEFPTIGNWGWGGC